MEQTTITAYFERDHDRLDGLLRTFQELKRSDYPEARAEFKEFKFGLQRHIVWEEDLLFPVWEQRSGLTQGGPTEVMRAEHRKIGACLEDLHQKVQEANPESDREEQALAALLEAHNVKEERVLYPAIDSALNDDERASLFNQMRNIPEERYRVCCGVHEG